jgi:hypothetical protein
VALIRRPSRQEKYPTCHKAANVGFGINKSSYVGANVAVGVGPLKHPDHHGVRHNIGGQKASNKAFDEKADSISSEAQPFTAPRDRKKTAQNKTRWIRDQPAQPTLSLPVAKPGYVAEALNHSTNKSPSHM